MSFPERLYKYQPVGPHTALNLVLMLKKGVLFFPRKHALNDPTDCEPNLVIPTTKGELVQALTRIQASADVLDFIRNEAAQAIEGLTSQQELVRAPKTILGGLYDDPIEKAKHLIRGVMRIAIGTPRIFSTSTASRVGQMWSYYANSHRGICLEISGLDMADEGLIGQRVIYTTERPQIFLEDVLELSKDGPKRDAIVKKLYCVKSDSWKHEDEYRLVARDASRQSDHLYLSIPDGDFIRVKSAKLTAVYFGQHCSDSDKWMIKDLIVANTLSDKRPEIFDVAQAADSYDFSASPASYERFGLFSLGKAALGSSASPPNKSFAGVLSGASDAN